MLGYVICSEKRIPNADEQSRAFLTKITILSYCISPQRYPTLKFAKEVPLIFAHLITSSDNQGSS
eukprot:scaffold290150_cov34-Attheya_sp.AAC.1